MSSLTMHIWIKRTGKGDNIPNGLTRLYHAVAGTQTCGHRVTRSPQTATISIRPLTHSLKRNAQLALRHVMPRKQVQDPEHACTSLALAYVYILYVLIYMVWQCIPGHNAHAHGIKILMVSQVWITPLIGLEPVAPIHPQFSDRHDNYSATETFSKKRMLNYPIIYVMP